MSRISQTDVDDASKTRTTFNLTDALLARLEQRLDAVNADRVTQRKPKWNRDRLAEHILNWGLNEWDAEDKKKR